mgnify:CR=1 FL=1
METYEIDHLNAVRALAPECMVLLRSDGAFPLAEPGEIALFGSGARHTIKGGTGSGDVNSRHVTTIEEGLEKAGFTLTTKAWLDAYDEVAQALSAFAENHGTEEVMLISYIDDVEVRTHQYAELAARLL